MGGVDEEEMEGRGIDERSTNREVTIEEVFVEEWKRIGKGTEVYM